MPTRQSTSDLAGSRSIDWFLGLVLVGALGWFVVFVCLTIVAATVTGGSQAAHDYMLGLAQTWFILALLGLFWLVESLVLGGISWLLKDAWTWLRIAVVGFLGSLGSSFLITPILLQNDLRPRIPIDAILVGVLPGLVFGVSTAVAVARKAVDERRSGDIGAR